MSILSFFLYFVSLLILMSCGDTTTDEPTSSQSGGSPSIVRPTIALDEPSSSPGNNPRPTFLVSGLQEGQIAQLFSDSTCQTSASGPSSGTEARIEVGADLTDGEHTFYFSVTTNEESVCSTESIAYTLDITPPSPSGLESDSEPKSSKNWTWSAPDDPDAQFRFTFTSNDTHTFEEEDAFSTTNTATTVGANLEDGTHYLHVEARDLAGNTSLVSVFFTIDTFAAIPSLELSSNSLSPGVLTTPTFDVSGLEENARVQLFSDATCETVASDEITNLSGTSRQVTVNSGIITADGPYSFYAKQTDSLGHVSECSVASRYVYDSSLFQVTGLTSDSTPSRTKSFSWQSNVSSGTVEFRSIINQNASYQFTAQDSWDSTTTLSKNDGTGTFYLHVQASSGDLRTEILSISFVLDNTAPDAPSAIALSQNIPMFAQNLTPSFVVSGLEVGANIELFSDSACQNSVSNSVLNASGMQTTITLSDNLQMDNTYYFYAKQTDTAGNPSNCSTAKATYTLDTSVPSAPSALVYSGSSPSNIRTPTIEVQGLEENARVQLFNDSTCSTSVSSEVTNTNGTDEALTSTAITGADGTYHFYAKQTDRAGNASLCSSETVSYQLDTSAPLAPSSLALHSNNPSPNNTTEPVLAVGGLEDNSVVRLYSDSSCTTIASDEVTHASGSSRDVTANTLATSGTYNFYSKQTDSAGNESSCSSETISYILDIDPPSPPALALTVPSVSISNDNTPTIEASGLAIGESISFYKSDDCSGTALGGVSISTNTQSYTFEALGSDGAYSFSAKAMDLAGNATCSTTPLAYTLDTTIATPSLALATGTLNPGADVSPEFVASGLDVGARVQLFSDSACSTVAGSEVANSSGTDELLTSSDLANDGTFSFYVKQTDTAGNSACSTTAVSYELDSSLFVVTGLQNGTSAVQSQTWSWGASPTNLSGTFRHIINQDATFTFNDTDHPWNTTTTATKDTESGRYYLHVQAQSTGNNTSAVVSVYVDLDNTAPTAPQGIAFGDDIRSPFSDTTPSFVVSALEEGSSVQLFSDSTCDTSASELVANASGNDEEVTVQTLTGGDVSYSFYAKQTDIAGNVSPCSTATIAYVLDTTSPDAPTGIRLSNGLNTDGNDTTPSLVVDGLEENAQVQLFTDSACSVQASDPVTNSSGRDQEITTSTLTGGDVSYSFYARQTDQAGNLSTCSVATVEYRLDTVSPSTPSALALGSSMRSPFNDQTPTVLVSGLEVGATVQLFSDNLCSTAASDAAINSSGTDEEVTTSSLAGGDMSYSFYAKQTDSVGNASPCSSETVSYQLDTSAPLAPSSLALHSNNPSPNNTTTEPVLAVGGLEDNSVVRLYSDSSCTTVASDEVTHASGASRDVTANALATSGTYNFYAKQTDSAGNESSCSSETISYILDIDPPSAPSLVEIASTESYSSGYGNDTTPTITVSGIEEGATIRLYSDNTCSTAASDSTINQSGSSEEVTASVLNTDNTYVFYANQKDPAGNFSSCSQTRVSYHLDTVAPAAPTSLAFSDGTSGTDSITRPIVLVGGLEVLSSVQLFTNNTCTTVASAIVANPDGTDQDVRLNELTTNGTYTFHAMQTDRAQNISSCSTVSLSYAFTLPPDPPTNVVLWKETINGVVVPISAGDDDSTPTLKVTASESGGSIKLYSDSICSTEVSVATDLTDTTAPFEVEITINDLNDPNDSDTEEGFYTFYAKHTTSDNRVSNCSQANARYGYFTTLANYKKASFFRGLFIESYLYPHFVDIDGDNDLDVFVTGDSRRIRYFKNTNGEFVEQTGNDNPLNFSVDDDGKSLLFANLDTDADLEVVYIYGESYVKYYDKNNQNTYVYTSLPSPLSFLSGFAENVYIDALDIADLDGDSSDMELVFGESGNLWYYNQNNSGNYERKTGNENPFNAINVSGGFAAPFFVDIPDEKNNNVVDGDLDLIIGTKSGTIWYYEKKSTGYVRQTGDDNPFNDIDVGASVIPSLVNIDSDSDLELFLGVHDGTILYYEKDNQGNYQRKYLSNSIINDDNSTRTAAPFLVNLDDDSELEMLVGRYSGKIDYYNKNLDGFYDKMPTGQNPFSGIDVGFASHPTLGNVDSDADLELIIGHWGNNFKYYDKDNSDVYREKTGNENPFNAVRSPSSSAYPQLTPFFVNLDSDSDLELVFGEYSGVINLYDKGSSGYTRITAQADNLFHNLDVGWRASPFLGQLDDDSTDIELLVGRRSESLRFYKLVSTNNVPVYQEKTGSENPFNNLSVSRWTKLFVSDMDGNGTMEVLFGGGRLNGLSYAIKYNNTDWVVFQ